MIRLLPPWRALGPALALLAAVLTPAACSRPRSTPARPALFMVRDADTVIWLFGTIHALPPGVDWQTPAIRTAVDRADTLVTEIPDAEFRDGAPDYDRLARLDPPVPALGRVAAEQRPALVKALTAAGLAPETAAALKTWAIATAIGSGDAVADGAERDAAPEAVLASRFRAAHKQQAALETIHSQLALFDALSETEQRALLSATLADLANPARRYPATLAAWEAGRLAALADPLPQKLAERLVTERNRRWADWIASRLHQPGAVLVAVGAGHLAGEQSLLALLARRGLRVTRIE